VENLVKMREALKQVAEDVGVKLSYMPIIVKVRSAETVMSCSTALLFSGCVSRALKISHLERVSISRRNGDDILPRAQHWGGHGARCCIAQCRERA
jgi:hypothetical protein